MNKKFFQVIFSSIIFSFLSSCASRTTVRDSTTVLSGLTAGSIGLDTKKPIQASLIINVSYGTDCINQRFVVDQSEKYFF